MTLIAVRVVISSRAVVVEIVCVIIVTYHAKFDNFDMKLAKMSIFCEFERNGLQPPI
jgi:hypothetical protein